MFDSTLDKDVQSPGHVRFKFHTLAKKRDKKRDKMIFRCFERVLYLQFGVFWREGRCQLEVLYFIPYVELTN